ncbi:SDR family NAD(P)-dependent oxidoreductase [Marinobacter sp. C2H3]|uniref:SDR family NAD(P)-dependent oxidoreductase n=1 Tax=Marinobacter sp. C2H3 TaxID=3119003 RepID=UPI00300F08CD
MTDAIPTTNLVIAGISGAVGGALARHCLQAVEDVRILGLCRRPDAVDTTGLDDRVFLQAWDATTATPDSVRERAEVAFGAPEAGIDLIIYAAGLLHDSDLFPEKRLEDVSSEAMARAFAVNCTGFATLMRGLVPFLRHRRLKKVVAISAKVGSIGDNGFGGWYAYRSAKAALNMVVRNLSIELGRRSRPIACIALHPGTTESRLSEPFQGSLAQLTVHTPAQTAENLWRVIDGLEDASNGQFLSWNGEELPW